MMRGQKPIDKDGEKADRALLLRDKYGLTYDVIAERLGTSGSEINHSALACVEQLCRFRWGR